MDFLHQDFLIICFRIFIALVLSGLIGLERGLKNHQAGFRTHILVGVGSCLMMVLSLYGFDDFMNSHENVQYDPSRIPSYVISGIGFLGAGTIIVNGTTIRGLTTAASIWAVAGLGLVVGVGMYDIALVTTLVIFLSLLFLNNFESRFKRKSNSVVFNITVRDNLKMEELLEVLSQYKLIIKNLEIEVQGDNKRVLLLEVDNLQNVQKLQLLNSISELNEVTAVEEQVDMLKLSISKKI